MNDLVHQVFLTVGATIFAFVPLWIYLLAKFVLRPNGFWRKLFLLSFFVWIFGVLQLYFFVLWIGFIKNVWF
jgi:hypothetical protein